MACKVVIDELNNLSSVFGMMYQGSKV